jgi:hypothetical protein
MKKIKWGSDVLKIDMCRNCPCHSMWGRCQNPNMKRTGDVRIPLPLFKEGKIPEWCELEDV